MSDEETVVVGVLETLDETPKAVKGLSLPPKDSVHVLAHVNATLPDESAADFTLQVDARRILGGDVELLSEVVTTKSREDLGASLNVSGGNIEVVVTGLPGTAILWDARIEAIILPT